jgi:hypothetical protein
VAENPEMSLVMVFITINDGAKSSANETTTGR